jgi:hypothetical protein
LSVVRAACLDLVRRPLQRLIAPRRNLGQALDGPVCGGHLAPIFGNSIEPCFLLVIQQVIEIPSGFARLTLP